ncbi:MAG: hypothetical protein IPK83_11800 [Planctomycetes bacterium]|nr:hypothetical protein [Planctomycetota bacterium]
MNLQLLTSRKLVAVLHGLIILASVLPSAIARADDRTGVKIRMPKETTVAAKSGEKYSGTLEITASDVGEIDSIDLRGDGWAPTSVKLPPNTKLDQGGQLNVPFQVECIDSSKSLEIRVAFDGRVRTKRLNLSPERFARRGKARPTIVIPSNELPYPQPMPVGGIDDGAPRGSCEDQLIHFRGRFAYYRPGVDNNGDGDFDDPGADNNGDGDYDDPGVDANGDGDTNDPGDIAPDVAPDVAPALVGADRIEFSIMDDDIIDEEIFRGLTNEDGSFDVTVCWDDCDISGCDDPDIYLYIECDTDIVNVQDGEDILEEDYNWSTESSQYYPDYTGHDIDFGTVLPADPAEYPAIHIHNTITRAHRFVQENDGSYIDHVDVQWPESDTEYIRFFEEIYIQPSEQWNEATQTHEWGHHLLYEWDANGSGDYCNGYCDDDNSSTCGGESCDNDGHCVWCQENAGDAWNEDFLTGLAQSWCEVGGRVMALCPGHKWRE